MIIRVPKRYSLKFIQVYMLTGKYSDEEVEAVYEDINRAIHASKTYFTVVMGDRWRVQGGESWIWDAKRQGSSAGC